eukprot:TRINITY_DN3261_c0_g7_i1.p1 TRINITY_DN3261_c0_g7~~TRINITY_DN3261_c0_g7_i1.p1  ORF type:complete len:451 (-),score=125.75 TRINITY_DN3261_c0_g7_i1:102-1454(-)
MDPPTVLSKKDAGGPMGLPPLDLAEVYAEELTSKKPSSAMASGRRSNSVSKEGKKDKKDKRKTTKKSSSNLDIMLPASNSNSSINPGNISPIHKENPALTPSSAGGRVVRTGSFIIDDKKNEKEKDMLIHRLMNRVMELEKSEKELLEKIADIETKHVETKSSSKLSLSNLFRSNKKTIALNDVTIGERLGAGGSSAVIFSCYVDGWQCAMKELDLEFMNEYEKTAFEGEVRLLELLPQHPNIVRYLFHENKNKKLRLFMTRYSSTLAQELQANRSKGRFQFSDCVKYALDIIKGLEFLHSNHIIHRDLKSDNIFVMLNERKEIMRLAIGDFDTAKKINSKNIAKTVLGTPQWMAPEVLNANEEGQYNFSADIYSFGMVVYELLAMKPPYHDCKSTMIAMNIIQHRRPTPPENLEPEYEPLMELYLNCTKPKPEERPLIPQIKEVLIDLV